MCAAVWETTALSPELRERDVGKQILSWPYDSSPGRSPVLTMAVPWLTKLGRRWVEPSPRSAVESGRLAFTPTGYGTCAGSSGGSPSQALRAAR